VCKSRLPPIVSKSRGTVEEKEMKTEYGNPVKLFLVLAYWTIEIGALQYNVFNRARASESTVLRNPTTAFPTVYSPPKIPNRCPTHYQPERIKEAFSFQKSALFSASTATDVGMEEESKKRGFFAKLRWLLIFPIVSCLTNVN
jgi:hypothetical protein